MTTPKKNIIRKTSIEKNFITKLKKEKIEFLSFYFTDVLGKFHSITFTVEHLSQEDLEKWIMFDGSSIEGFKTINESDMIVKPDISTYFQELHTKIPTGAIICDVIEPVTWEPYNRDPRSTLKRTNEYLKNTWIGDTAYFWTEPEFFIFDKKHISLEEGTIKNKQFIAHETRKKKNYFQPSYFDPHRDTRSQIVKAMNQIGVVTTLHHSEVWVNQNEIGTKYADALCNSDSIQKYKYAVHTSLNNLHEKVATFMPKPLLDDNGSGMHMHQSIWKTGENTFAGDKYAGLSQEALWYIGGIRKHAKAINAFSNPIVNSYKRLVPGFEAPSYLAYSAKNRSAAIRIPHSNNQKWIRIEVRFPDASANPYLTTAAMIMAGLDGIENKIDPGRYTEKDLDKLTKAEAKEIPTTSKSLKKSLEALDTDREFLKKWWVFSDDQIDGYITLKTNEIKKIEESINTERKEKQKHKNKQTTKTEIQRYFSV